MEEGEALSKKQLAQEQTIKKLRGQVKELQGAAAELGEALEAERAKAASAVSERASTAGELYAIREQHAAELAAERQHYERLLGEAREAAAAAEARAADAAKAGAARRLREAEARVEALEGALGEMRGELERQVRAWSGGCSLKRGGCRGLAACSARSLRLRPSVLSISAVAHQQPGKPAHAPASRPPPCRSALPPTSARRCWRGRLLGCSGAAPRRRHGSRRLRRACPRPPSP
jgi:hypothetical protein